MSVAASGASRASWHVPADPRTRVRVALRAAGVCAHSAPRVEEPKFAAFVGRGLREHLLPFGSR